MRCLAKQCNVTPRVLQVIACMVARHLGDDFTNLSAFSHLGKTNANKLLKNNILKHFD